MICVSCLVLKSAKSKYTFDSSILKFDWCQQSYTCIYCENSPISLKIMDCYYKILDCWHPSSLSMLDFGLKVTKDDVITTF